MVELHEGEPLTGLRRKTGTPAVSGQRMKESGDYLIYGNAITPPTGATVQIPRPASDPTTR